jgi:hypothetical protein
MMGLQFSAFVVSCQAEPSWMEQPLLKGEAKKCK